MKWIDVKQELPPKAGQYLCYYPECRTAGLWTNPRIIVLGWSKALSSFRTSFPVSHWMPLPDPPAAPPTGE